METLLDEGYLHDLLPQTLGYPQKTKAECFPYWKGLIPWFNDLNVTIYEIVESPLGVAIHGASTATSTTGAPYANEYMFMVRLKEQPDGKLKIIHVKEFIDSKVTLDFFPAEGARQAELQKKQA